MTVEVLAKVQTNENLTEEDKKERKRTYRHNQNSLESNVEQEDNRNTTFSPSENRLNE